MTFRLKPKPCGASFESHAMRVLMYSRPFYPLIGGQEIAVAQLATALTERGWEVRVVTCTPWLGAEAFPFTVVRNPRPISFLCHLLWSDVFLHAGLSLRGAWPLLLIPRPWVVVHHTWYRRPDGRLGWENRLKRLLLRRAAASVAVSRALADDLGTPTIVIPNAYRDRVFRRLPGIERIRDLVFVGRLVPDKGVDLLLGAFCSLRAQGLRPSVSIIGDGPMRPKLEALAAELKLEEQVVFLGIREGEELCRLLNAHRILVVPSRWPEPFGIVALEGIASGCVVVGSTQGGLPEAIGPCGVTFPPCNVEALANILSRLLSDSATCDALRQPAAGHLCIYTTEAIAARYAAVLEQVTETQK